MVGRFLGARSRPAALLGHRFFARPNPSGTATNWGYGAYGNYLSVEVLENAVKIAETESDRARAHFLLGRHYTNQGGNITYRGRAERELGAVIELGKQSEWYDDALYHLGNFLESYGKAQRDENRNWVWEQDFVGAVALYRRLLNEFDRGETRYFDDAENRIRDITGAQLEVFVDQFFLPDSEVAYRLFWRNLETVELSLFPVDLTQARATERKDAARCVARVDRHRPARGGAALGVRYRGRG